MSDLDLDFDAPDDAGLSADGDAGSSSSGGGSMDYGVVGGLALSFGMVIGGLYLEGSTIGAYKSVSAAAIVIGGTLGATMTSIGLTRFQQMPASVKRAVTFQPPNRGKTIRQLVGFAEKARREGLLVLEDDLRETNDQFMRKGVQLVVDGTDPELVKEILRTEVDSLYEELHGGAKVWEKVAGYFPTFGIIGTVIGLVLVLSNISDPASLAASIAVAFIATLYGVGLANLVALPIGMRLQDCANDEVSARELVIEGILAIQSGDNPRIVEEKLVAFLSTKDRAAFRASQEGPDTGDLDLDMAA